MAKGSKPPPPKPPPPAVPVVRVDTAVIDWRNTHIWGFQPVRDLMIVAAIVGLFYLGYVASVVTVPLLIAMLLAYLCEPLVRWMTRGGWITRPGAVVMIIVLAALVVVVPVTVGVGFAVVQGARIAGLAAEVASNLLAVTRFVDAAIKDGPGGLGVVENRTDPLLESRARSEGARFRFVEGARGALPGELAADERAFFEEYRRPGAAEGEEAPPDPALATAAYERLGPAWMAVADQYIEQQLEAGAGGGPTAASLTMKQGLEWVREHGSVIGRRALGTGAQAVGVALSTAKRVGLLLFGGFLTAFFFYFLSTGYGRVLKFWDSLIPERRRGRAVDLLMQMDRVVSGFVRGRITIALILGAVYTVGYWLVGVPAPLIMGPLVGLFTLVPYVALVGIPVCSLLMALEPSGVAWQTAWWWVLLAPAGVYALGQAMDDYLLSPMIQGKQTGMDTPTILFASIAGGALAGVYGLLLAIPIAACIKVLLKEVFWPRFRAWAEGRADDVLPISKG